MMSQGASFFTSAVFRSKNTRRAHSIDAVVISDNLLMALQPESKARREGENVTFCCDAQSNGGYDYVEW